MTKKTFTFILTACIFGLSAQAQKEENVWIFGQAGGLGLDFNAGSPANSIPAPAFFDSYEATASVSDPLSGQLLFYTEGDNVYNKNGLTMPNGTALTGITSVTSATPTSSGAQSALIVPMPGTTGKYYLFSLTDVNSYIFGKVLFPGFYPDQSGFLYYSIIDMNLNGGLGDVVAGKKGIPVDTTSHFTEHMLGVAGNHCNVWVVLLDPQRETNNISRFKSFNVTAEGVDSVPVVSDVFTVSQSLAPYNTQTGFGQSVGHICVSPNRQKLALAVGSSLTRQRLTLFDFDAGTGTVSKPILLDTAFTAEPDNQYYGVCFSPDNTKLYANDWGHLGDNKIYQFDVSSNNASTIIGSRVTVSASSNYFSGIKRGPDNKVYYFYSPEQIGVIRNPDLPGMACDPDTAAIAMPLESGKNFPNVVPVAIPPAPLYTATDSLICGDAAQIGPRAPLNSTSGHTWSNGQTTPTIVIEQDGTYWVSYLEQNCQERVDTFRIELQQPNPVITIKVFDLSTTRSYNSYQWMVDGALIAGATNSVYTVETNGDYQVIVSNENGCIDTSDIYPVRNAAIEDLIDIAAQIQVYPNPSEDEVYIAAPIPLRLRLTDMSGSVIPLSGATNRIPVRNLATGTYLLYLSDMSGQLVKVEKVVRKAH